MRFSAAPSGTFTDTISPWSIYGERAGEPDGLEASAFSGVNLAPVAGTPGAPMFETESLFGAHVAGLPVEITPGDPVVICVHSLFYEPRRPVAARAKSDNAHRTVFHFDETPGGAGSREERARHLTPWFRRLLTPHGRGDAAEATGVALGFCYASYGGSTAPFGPALTGRLYTALGGRYGTRPPPTPMTRAYMDAERAGFALAAVLRQLMARLDAEGLPEQEIDILCHGLGARVAMSALALLSQRFPGDPAITRIGRVIVLGGLCHWGQAAHTLANLLFSEARSRPAFYNVMMRNDDLLRWIEAHRTAPPALDEAAGDLSLEATQVARLAAGQVIGRSGKPPADIYSFFGPDYPEWIDLSLDDPVLRRVFSKRGASLETAPRWSLGDHGAYFTRPGNWALYRAVICERTGWSIPELQVRLSRAGAATASR